MFVLILVPLHPAAASRIQVVVSNQKVEHFEIAVSFIIVALFNR